MANKNVNSFLTTGFIDLNTSDSLLGIVNGDLKRLNAGSISMVNLTAITGTFSNGSTPSPLVNNPLTVVGSGNSFMQLNIQNRASGTFASADLVITANNGTDSTNFINLGINNSGYNDPLYNNATGLDGYLFIDGGDLGIGTRTPGKIIEFHAGGTTENKVISRIDASGMNMVSGTYRVNNVPYNTFTITLTHSADSPRSGFNYFGINDLGFSQSTALRRKIPIMETCQIRKASWTHFVGTTGSPAAILSTGYVINTSSIPPQTGIISAGIDSSSDTTPGQYNTIFSTPINITSGDLVIGALAISGYTSPSGFPNLVRDSVILYCYN
jgi:hypothetical protein